MRTDAEKLAVVLDSACKEITKERDDYQRLSQEYTTVIMELKAESEVLKAEIERLKLATPLVLANFDLP